MDAQVMELADGRELAWGEIGDPAGAPVLLLHGTPGSRHQVLVDTGAATAAGVRIIGPDRPGYGLSTFQRGRTLEGSAHDLAELADHLGLERFAVAGISGGGPHAVACAAFLPDRVTAAALLSSIGPVGTRGSEAGMMPANRLFTKVARRIPAANSLPFGLLAVLGRRRTDRMIALATKAMPAPDAAVLARPEVRAAFRTDLANASATTGRAAAQDFGLAARDWGFRLEDITVPVQVWHAEADVNVPVAHARVLAERIPGAVLHLLPDEGHLMCIEHLEEILRELLASRR